MCEWTDGELLVAGSTNQKVKKLEQMKHYAPRSTNISGKMFLINVDELKYKCFKRKHKISNNFFLNIFKITLLNRKESLMCMYRC